MVKSNKPLSQRFRDAYDVSYRAPIDDSGDDVKQARKALRGMKRTIKKKLDTVSEICEAARVTKHPIEYRACTIRSAVESDYTLLLREMERIKKQ
jgi:hypothetical protein